VQSVRAKDGFVDAALVTLKYSRLSGAVGTPKSSLIRCREHPAGVRTELRVSGLRRLLSDEPSLVRRTSAGLLPAIVLPQGAVWPRKSRMQLAGSARSRIVVALSFCEYRTERKGGRRNPISRLRW